MGHITAVMSAMVASRPARYRPPRTDVGRSSPAGAANSGLPLSSHRLWWMWPLLPDRLASYFAMKVAASPWPAASSRTACLYMTTRSAAVSGSAAGRLSSNWPGLYSVLAASTGTPAAFRSDTIAPMTGSSCTMRDRLYVRRSEKTGVRSP